MKDACLVLSQDGTLWEGKEVANAWKWEWGQPEVELRKKENEVGK